MKKILLIIYSFLSISNSYATPMSDGMSEIVSGGKDKGTFRADPERQEKLSIVTKSKEPVYFDVEGFERYEGGCRRVTVTVRQSKVPTITGEIIEYVGPTASIVGCIDGKIKVGDEFKKLNLLKK